MGLAQYIKRYSMNNSTSPGSTEAISKGCLCPITDNCRGRGYWGGVRDGNGNLIFVIRSDCPLHGEIVTETLCVVKE